MASQQEQHPNVWQASGLSRQPIAVSMVCAAGVYNRLRIYRTQMNSHYSAAMILFDKGMYRRNP